MANRFEQQSTAPATGDELMAALGIDAETERRGSLFHDGQVSNMVTNSEAIGARFSQRLHAAHRASFIMKKYGIDDLSSGEISEYCKTETWRYLENFPVGTRLTVTAAPDCFITVFDSAGYPDKILESPVHIGPDSLQLAEPAGSFETFTVGDSNLRIDFSSRDEAVLIDDNKSVLLTFHDPDPQNPRSEEVPNYRLLVKLPDNFERTVSL